MRPIAASGHSVKTSVASTPHSAAKPSGAQYTATGSEAGSKSREQRSRKQRRGAAQHQADRDTDQRQRQDLQQIGGEDEAGRGAEAFQRRDRLGLARDISGDGVADPDAADKQRGDAGQAEKKPEPVEQSLQRRRCLGAAAQAPAGLRKGGAGPFDPGGGVAAFRQS